MVRIRCDDGGEGVGYSYTIGTGGSSVVALLQRPSGAAIDRARSGVHRSDLARPAVCHACHQRRRDHEPGAGRDRHRAVGLALQARRPAAVEGGGRREAAHAGLHDRRRLAAPRPPTPSCARPWPRKRRASRAPRSRSACRAWPTTWRVCPPCATPSASASRSWSMPTSASRSSEALRRAAAYADLGIAWFEEPLPADDITGHARLAASTPVPIAVGESLYSPSQFAAYIQQGACSDRCRSMWRASAASRPG